MKGKEHGGMAGQWRGFTGEGVSGNLRAWELGGELEEGKQNIVQ